MFMFKKIHHINKYLSYEIVYVLTEVLVVCFGFVGVFLIYQPIQNNSNNKSKRRQQLKEPTIPLTTPHYLYDCF